MDFYDQGFYRNFLISLGLHILLFLLAFAGGQVVSRIFKSNDVEVIQSSVRVDVVGMPKFTIQELKQVKVEDSVESVPQVSKTVKEDTKAEAEDVVKKDDLILQEEGKKKESFLNLLQDYSSKKVTSTHQKKSVKNSENTNHLDSLVIEGNKLSKGSSLVGGYTDVQNSEFSSYVQNIPQVIKPFWKLPSYLLEKNLRCRIKMFLSTEGKLLKLEIQESSGVAEFDSRAESAIRDSNFPKPSEEVGKRLTQSGIILGFPI